MREGATKMQHQGPDIDFAGPATYRVVIEGHLDSSYSSRLAGMTISTTERSDRKPLTILVGAVRDQAELSGVLDTLYSLHLSIVSVEKITDDG
jgi:hypothetical protein